MESETENRILEFAARIGKIVNALPDNRLSCHIADQLVRSGTSPASDYSEARALNGGENSNRKLELAIAALRETGNWIKLIQKSQLLPAIGVDKILEECKELGGIIGKSIITEEQSPKST